MIISPIPHSPFPILHSPFLFKVYDNFSKKFIISESQLLVLSTMPTDFEIPSSPGGVGANAISGRLDNGHTLTPVPQIFRLIRRELVRPPTSLSAKFEGMSACT